MRRGAQFYSHSPSMTDRGKNWHNHLSSPDVAVGVKRHFNALHSSKSLAVSVSTWLKKTWVYIESRPS